MTNLVLIKSAHFNGSELDCYVEPNQQDNGNFWATREQIGSMLGYSEPRISIANIHQRNKERLDKFSRVIKMITHEENRSVTRDVTVYSFKGLLEICRYSNQPKADAVMDWLFEVADEIRLTGSYSINKEQPALPSGVLDGARLIFETAGIKDNQLTLALDKVYKSYTGRSALQSGEVDLIAPEKKQLLTPTEIGQQLGISARKVNELLAYAGYQHKISGLWESIGEGERYAVMLDTNKKRSEGTPVRQLKWSSNILNALEHMLQEEVSNG